MQSLKILKIKLENQFVAMQHPRSGPKIPREGHYFIKDVKFEPVGKHNNHYPVATVNWAPEGGIKFNPLAEFKIALNSLTNFSSTGPKDIPAEELVDKLIFINSVGIVYDGSGNGIVKLNWGILQATPKFQTPTDAFFDLFTKPSTTVADIHNLSFASLDKITVQTIIDEEADYLSNLPIKQLFVEEGYGELSGLDTDYDPDDFKEQR